MAKMKEGFSTDRKDDVMRDIKVDIDFTDNALASVLYSQGNTVVLACATKAPSLPRWFPRDASRGWVHAEYSLLPGSTDSRFRRERGGAKGRTQEIERLVARSLRASIDLEQLGPIALTVDCDILNADGGTRCASITAACIALRLAVRRLIASGECQPVERRVVHGSGKPRPEPLTGEAAAAHESKVMPNDVAAISVGLLEENCWLDLDYILDSNADVDMNVVMTSDGRLVEVQGTGEEATFSRKDLNALIDLAESGCSTLFDLQRETLSDLS
jgi:ribonuclease PH